MQFVGNDLSKIAGGVDVIFIALPHGESMKFLPQLIQSGVKIVDLSADFRLKDGVIELLDVISRLGNGEIRSIEVRCGLPVSVEVEWRPEAPVPPRL